LRRGTGENGLGDVLWAESSAGGFIFWNSVGRVSLICTLI